MSKLITSFTSLSDEEANREAIRRIKYYCKKRKYILTNYSRRVEKSFNGHKIVKNVVIRMEFEY